MYLCSFGLVFPLYLSLAPPLHVDLVVFVSPLRATLVVFAFAPDLLPKEGTQQI